VAIFVLFEKALSPNKQMAKEKTARGNQMAFTKTNYQLFGLSAVVLLIGYWALSQPPVDGFLSLTLAPILLVVGYCVLIPTAIMFRPKQKTQES